MSSALLLTSSILRFNSSSRSSSFPISAQPDKPSVSKSHRDKPTQTSGGRERDKLRNLFSSNKQISREKGRSDSIVQPLLSPESLISNEDEEEGPNHNNGFVKLVPEILQYIATFLLPCEAAILSLVCKDLLDKIGTRYLSAMTSNSSPLPQTFETYFYQRNFLVLLSQDMLGRRYCDDCRKIHNYTPPYLRSWSEKKRQKRECDIPHWKQGKLDCFHIMKDQRVNFANCEALMKNYRRGLDIKKELEGLQYYRLHPTKFYKRIKLHQTRTCKIYDGSLVVRSYFKVFIPFGSDGSYIWKKTKDLAVCPHVYRSLRGTNWFDFYITNECERGLAYLDPKSPRYMLERGLYPDSFPESEDDEGAPANSPVGSQSGGKSFIRSLLPTRRSKSVPRSSPVPMACPVRACINCPTEYHIQMQQGTPPVPLPVAPLSKRRKNLAVEQPHGKKGMNLILSVYTDLGPCRESWDVIWQCGPHNEWSGECRSKSWWPLLTERKMGRLGTVIGKWDGGL